MPLPIWYVYTLLTANRFAEGTWKVGFLWQILWYVFIYDFVSEVCVQYRESQLRNGMYRYVDLNCMCCFDFEQARFMIYALFMNPIGIGLKVKTVVVLAGYVTARDVKWKQ